MSFETSEEYSKFMQLPRYAREAAMKKYCKKLLSHAVSHCMIQCENRQALSEDIALGLREISDTIDSIF